MGENNFKKQIYEDISYYRYLYPNIKNLYKDEWAFNFWVLDKIYRIDEEIIESQITDYNDKGIDCFAFFEETKELFLIQNKFYDSSKLTSQYIENDFLLRPIIALEQGTYKRSKELQTLYNKYSKDKDFIVYLQLFVSNNDISESAYEVISEFNKNYKGKYKAEIFGLNEIELKYYGKLFEVKKNMIFDIDTVNSGTVLQVNTKDYGINNPLDAKYIFTPVLAIYELIRKAKILNYPLFAENIREYLGNRGINKNIYKTLLDSEDRKNFFYYNNGITITCEDMSPVKTSITSKNRSASINITNPQIVNGCQTVNSIYEALNNFNPQNIIEEFKDTFVMTKILKINPNDISNEQLYKSIVRYNNSQNCIDEKTFVANNDIFNRLQEELEKKGFLLLIKQSDQHKFAEQYVTPTKLLDRNSNYLSKYGMSLKTTKEHMISLEKLLQVILAFCSGGYQAYTKKSSLLKFGSIQYNTCVDAIKKFTLDEIINLYLLYLRSETEKKNSQNNRTPIPYYLIDCFAKYDCNDRDITKVLDNLSNPDVIGKLMEFYKRVTKSYSIRYEKIKGTDYNKMIKQDIDYELIEECRELEMEMV